MKFRPFLLLSFLTVFIFFLLPSFDTDLGWHLRYGEHFFNNGWFLTKNTLTVLMADYVWPNSYSFYQVLTFFIFNKLGFIGLSVFGALLFLSVFYLFYLFSSRKIYSSFLAFAFLIFSSWHVFYMGFRAQIFSLLGLLILLNILKNKGKFLYFLPILFFLWANFHGAFVLGILVLLAYFLLKVGWGIYKGKLGQDCLILGIVFLFSVLATFINPYGWGVWWEAWHHLSLPMHTLIAEWVRPNLFIVFIIVLVYLFSIVSFALSKKKSFFTVFLFFLLIPFFYLSLSARRNTAFFVVLNLCLYSELFSFKKLEQNINFISLVKALILMALGVFCLIRIPKVLAVRDWESYAVLGTTRMPFGAVEYMNDRGLRGDVYNAYEWGGFLSWQLKDNKLFVDGRMPAWPHPSGKSPYTIYLELVQAQPGWQKTIDEYGIDYLLIGNGTFLDLELQEKDNFSEEDNFGLWQELYRDDGSVLYGRI